MKKITPYIIIACMLLLSFAPPAVWKGIGLMPNDSTKVTGILVDSQGIRYLTSRLPFRNPAPAGVANYTTLFVDSIGRICWINGAGWRRTFDATGITANRVYSLPDATGTLAMLSQAQTWSAAQTYTVGQTFGSTMTSGTPIIVNTASGYTGNLVSYSVNSSSKMSLAETGILTLSSHLQSNGDLRAGTSSDIYFNSSCRISAPSNGVLKLANNAANDFDRFVFGGTTSAYPALKRSGARFLVRKADDASYSGISIGGGSATAGTAPWMMFSGTLMTTAEAGAGEYNGSWYLTKGSALRLGIGGTVWTSSTQTANSGSGETTIYTYTTPANTFANAGEYITFEWGGVTAANTNSKTIKAYFAGTEILNIASTTSAASWNVKATVIMQNSSRVSATVTAQFGTASNCVTREITGLTLSGTNVISLTGTGVSSSDITGYVGTGHWYAVAAN